MQENCTRVSQPSSKITITNVIFLYFFTPRKVSVVEILRGAHMLRPWYKSEKVQVVPCLCFIRKSFHWISRLYTNPLYSKLYRNCDLLELYTSLGFWKIMTLDAALSISCAVFVSASDRLLAKMSHFTLFAALFFSFCRHWAKRGTSRLGTKKPAKPPMFWHLERHLEYQAWCNVCFSF